MVVLAQHQERPAVLLACPIAADEWVVLAGARLDAPERCQAAARGFLSAWGRDFQLARADRSLQDGPVRPGETALPQRAVPQTAVWRRELRAGTLVSQVAKRAQLDESESARLWELRVLPLRARQAQVLAPWEQPWEYLAQRSAELPDELLEPQV